jgi:tRNA(Ile)-lysidine synthase
LASAYEVCRFDLYFACKHAFFLQIPEVEEIRNPNAEIRNNPKARITNTKTQSDFVTHELQERVEAYLEREAIRGGAMLVAVSGGPDSVALLLALVAAEPGRELHIVAAHLNHLLRGEESEADQRFVEELCAQQSIGCRVDRQDVRAFAEQSGENLEATARSLRYDWLTRLAGQLRARWVATGHTADDQAETVLHHLFRGTGLRGLRGVARRRPLAGGIEVVRPLLRVPRAQVLDFLKEQQIIARTDSTNLDLRLTRNRIRHELLPLLRAEYSPAITEHLCQLAEHAQALYAEVEVAAQQVLTRAERPRAGDTVVLDVPSLCGAPRHLVREALHLVWDREGWPVGGMNFQHWQRLTEMIDAEQGAQDLPDGLTARRKGRVLQLQRKTGYSSAGAL